jgi:type II restriction enzyme
MKLGFEEVQSPHASGSQSARVWIEQWVQREVYWPNCGNRNVSKFVNNRPVADFFCVSCREEYELKSQKNKFGGWVRDGAFRTMCERLASSNNPNLMLLNYDEKRLSVVNMLVVPKHFFVREIIRECPPLKATARRAGWVGCNNLLNQIPLAGKIFMIRDGLPLAKESVRAQWNKTLFLRDEGIEARGWLIEVMKCVELIGNSEFQLEDVYAYEMALSRLYPDNRHVRQKIRQQLQVLRDCGYLDFVSRGKYRLRS